MTISIFSLSSLICTIIGIIFWFIYIFILRYINFELKEGKWERKKKRGGAENEGVRSEEKTYHNNAIYRDFEFFFKVTLSIIGGTAFIVIQSQVSKAARGMIEIGGILQIIAGIIFCLFIAAHQKSKIERWDRGYNFWESFTWQESYMVTAIFLISFFYGLHVAQEIANLLPK